MGAIYGIWQLDGRPIDPQAVQGMSRRLVHRGPDDCREWQDGPVALGQRTLHATPRAGNDTPPLTRDGAFVLTADARLDNRSDLIAKLELDSAGVGDADLLLAGYARWGDECVAHLIGDFAFAIWDARRQVLFCARDHFGVKPLYYAHLPGRLFAFASEVEALLSLAQVPGEIDEFEVARHLLIPVGSDMSSTYYRTIRRQLPANRLIVSSRGVTERAYWELDSKKELILPSDEAYAEALRATFQEAVRCRLDGSMPVASMLSGGIDSSAITCAAAILRKESGDGPVHTLSAVYPRVPESDERAYIDEVLNRHAGTAHFFEADAVNPIAEIDRMNRLIGGPSWGLNLYLNWVLYGVGAQTGSRVVLDGFDGDVTVSHGLGYLSELALAGRWLELARVVTPYSRRRGVSVVADYGALVRFGIRRRMSGGIGQRILRGIRSPGGPAGPDEVRAPGAWQLVANPDFAGRFRQHLEPGREPPTTERERHKRHLRGAVLLEELGWNEACGAGRSVEVRFPFFDVRLAELCLSFPPDQKLRQGWTRYVMRRAMEGILPPEIQWRLDKANLHPGWVAAYRANEDGRIANLLERAGPELEAYLDVGRLRSLYERFLAGDIDTPAEMALWRGLSLALWLDGSRSGP